VISALFLLVGLSLPVDKAAHFGLSYVAHHTIYKACAKLSTGPGPDPHPVACHLLAGMAVISAGLVWESEGNEDPYDMLADTLGIGFAVVVIEW